MFCVYIYTLWLFNIAMERSTMLLIGKPSTNGPFSMAMLNNQRVYALATGVYVYIYIYSYYIPIIVLSYAYHFYHIPTMWGPPVISWFRCAPVTSSLFAYHKPVRDIGVMFTNLDILGASHCIFDDILTQIAWTCICSLGEWIAYSSNNHVFAINNIHQTIFINIQGGAP